MNKFELNIDSREKNVEELYREIERLNKNNKIININEIKSIFIKN